MNLLKKNTLLIVIIALALGFRLINLSSIPVGFNDDETAFGYNAYSVLTTGRDEWGRLLPFPAFESFGDWKLIGYLYLTVPSVFLFGLNEFSTRLPSALFGVFTVFATYLFTKEVFNKKIAYLAALLIAISPWHIIATRNAYESDLLTFFIPIATYFFLKGLKNKKYLTLALITFALSFYIYRSSWTFVPAFIGVLLYFNFKKLKVLKFNFVKNLIIFLILISPLIPTVMTFRGQSRFLQESFIAGINRVGITNDINEKRGVCQQKLPKFICILSYNKYQAFLSIYVNNYLKNLSPNIYFDTASPTGFQSFATRSVFYLFELPLIIFGLIFLFRNKHPALKILIPWILIVPIGAAIAGVANYGRINLIMPAPQIIAAFGFISILEMIKPKNLKTVFIILSVFVVSVSLVKFTIDLFYQEPYYTSRYQRYGYKQLFNFISLNWNSYENIYLSEKIDSSHQYIQYLFFNKVDPAYFQSIPKARGSDGWIILNDIGKIHFVPSIGDLSKIPAKSLVVVGQSELAIQIPPLSIIRDVRGDEIFEVLSGDQLKQQDEKLKILNNSKIEFR